jgi:hypothetical protein
MNLKHLQQIICRDLTQLSLARPRNRRYDGFMVTMRLSGTHWLKHLLATVLAEQYGLPAPEHVDDHRTIGIPADPPIHVQGVPRIVHSHALPSPLVHAPPVGNLLQFPRYILLIRDLRAAEVSHYEKYKDRFPAKCFSEFLRSDAGCKKYGKGIWWKMRFLNAWNRVRRWQPDHVHVVHYELLRSDTHQQLRAICDYLGMTSISDDVLQRAIAASTKENMAQRENPDKPHKVVRQSRRDPVEWFSDDDRRFFNEVTSRYLHDPFGYDYTDWSTANAGPARPDAQAQESK